MLSISWPEPPGSVQTPTSRILTINRTYHLARAESAAQSKKFLGDLRRRSLEGNGLVRLAP